MAGADDRQGHGEKDAQTAGAEIGRRLLQRAVNGVDGGRHHQEYEGKELQREDQDDALPSVDVRHLQAEGLEDLGEHAVPSQQNQPGLGADERRKDEGQRAQGLDEVLARDVVAGKEEGERDADDERKEGRQRTDEEAVPQAAQIIGIVEERGVALQRKKAGFRVDEAGLEDKNDRIDDSEEKDREDQNQDHVPRLKILAQGANLTHAERPACPEESDTRGFRLPCGRLFRRDRGLR